MHPNRKNSGSIADFIIDKRKSIEVVFAVLTVLSLFCYFFVGVNYDLTRYLPSATLSQQGLEVMKREFGYPGTARVMVDNVTLYEAEQYKNRIEKVDGVNMVTGADSEANVYGAGSFIEAKDIGDYYKNGYAIMDIVFREDDESTRTSRAIDQIKAIVGSKGHLTGTAVQDKSLRENLQREMVNTTGMAVVIILFLLFLTTTSWFEPVLFLLVIGIAIIINSGTNIFLGNISFMTSSVGPVLQLAVSMDYSIFMISSYTAERAKGEDLTTAVANALRRSSKSIVACGLATFFGFIALALMKFSIGFDLGIVLAKGIVTSVLTVLFLMPSLIIQWSNVIEKTSHKPLLPPFKKFARVSFKIRYVMLAIALIVAVPAYIGKGMNDFTYGSTAVGGGPGTKYYADEQAIDKQFGRSNMLLALVPNTSIVKERQLSEEIRDLGYTKSVTSLAESLPQGIPPGILPESITSQLHSKNYARILIYIKTDDESAAAFRCSDQIRSIVNRYYPEGAYLVGTTPFTEDIKTTINSDYDFVDMLSLLSVSLVVLITFHSLIIAVLIMVPIEIAIFINMLFPYLVGDKLIFMGYLIVSCIQLGATVDYAILMTNNYIESRSRLPKKEATIDAIATTTPPLLTSAAILSSAGYLLYFTSSIGAIGSMGHLIGRGTLLSLLLVVTVLPALLYLFDGAVGRHLKRMQRLREKAAAKRRRLTAAVSNIRPQQIEKGDDCSEDET